MEQEALYFHENSITKSAFHKNKKQININEVDIKYLFKYLIEYRHKGNTFPLLLSIKLPQMNKNFDKIINT